MDILEEFIVPHVSRYHVQLTGLSVSCGPWYLRSKIPIIPLYEGIL